MSTETFTFSSTFNASAEELFTWHERPGAFARLNPPWDPVELRGAHTGITDGTRVQIAIPIGPLRIPWTLEHLGYVKGKQFQDTQLSGPFKSWLHTHSFKPDGENRCILDEQIEYELPLGSLGTLFGDTFTKAKLEQLFRYRHKLTKSDIETHRLYSETPLSVAISGASGMVGSALMPFLTTGGHSVAQIVRSNSSENNNIGWSPYKGEIELSKLEGLDAVVHLSGENLASGPWTDKKKQRIRDSRTLTTRFLAESLARLASPPKVLISASAVGFYGNRGDSELSEEAEVGEGFLADVCREWEEATNPAREAGIRVVNLRIGIILSASGGALEKMLLPFRLGVGGRLGDGTQYMSWIGLQDLIRLILFAIKTDSLHGAVNACSPDPLQNRDFTKILGKVLNRPTVVPVPGMALKTLFPTLAEEALLVSQRAIPEKAMSHGFSFELSTLEDALKFTLGKL